MTTQLPRGRYLLAKRVGVGILCVACVIVLLGLVFPFFGMFWGRGRPRPNLAPTDNFLSSVTLPIDSRPYRPQPICLKTDNESSVQDSIWRYSLTRLKGRVTLSLYPDKGRAISFQLNSGDIIPLGNQLYLFTNVSDQSMKVQLVTKLIPRSFVGQPSSIYLCINSSPQTISRERIKGKADKTHEVDDEAVIDGIARDPLSAKITVSPIYYNNIPQESRTRQVESHTLHRGDVLSTPSCDYEVRNIVAPIVLRQGHLVGWVELSAIRHRQLR